MESDPHLFVNHLAIDDPHRVVKVLASDGRTSEQRELAYTNCKVIGNGSFGVVFQAKLLPNSSKDSEDVAIKKVLQDKRFKVPLHLSFFFCHFSNFSPFCPFCITYHAHLRRFTRQNRELQIMRLVSHPNVVDLKAFFYSNGDKVGTHAPLFPFTNSPHFRRTRFISTSCSNMYLKPCIAPAATIPNSNSPCPPSKLNCTCINSCAPLLTSTRLASAIVTSNLRICS